MFYKRNLSGKMIKIRPGCGRLRKTSDYSCCATSWRSFVVRRQVEPTQTW
jgi:hypothetical protein